MIFNGIILIIYCAFLQGVFNAGMDAIKFKVSDFIFQTDYWLSKGAYSPGKTNRLKKHILVFLADGWHLLKTFMVLMSGLITYISVAHAGSLGETPWSLLFIPGYYMSFSLGHIFGYNWFWIK